MWEMLVVPGSRKARPLSEKRQLTVGGTTVAPTPLLVPSFSSKGFPKVRDLVEAAAEIITDTCLISAYDVYHRLITGNVGFAEFVFLDSGGYESSKDFEFSELGHELPKRLPWSVNRYRRVLTEWASTTPTIAVSYDHPTHRVSFLRQIDEAKSLFSKRSFGREILVKPEKKGEEYVDVKRLLKHVHALAEFDAIGLTEKELGKTPAERMRSIAILRRSLQESGLETPIHIFGSLDTVSSPLYFLAGADIFDGLTWLRMGYHMGMTVYLRNMALLEFPAATPDEKSNAQILARNYQYLRRLQSELRRFLNDGDFSVFSHNRKLFKDSHEELIATL